MFVACGNVCRLRRSARSPQRLRSRVGDTEGLVGPLRSAVRSVDRRAADRIGRLDEQMLAQFSGTPVVLGIIAGFGLFALALAALGLFSVISYMVARTNA